MVLNCHTSTPPSCAATRRDVPSGDQATGPHVWSVETNLSCPVAASQTRKTHRKPADAIDVPSGDQARLCTLLAPRLHTPPSSTTIHSLCSSVCPLYVPITTPLCPSLI